MQGCELSQSQPAKVLGLSLPWPPGKVITRGLTRRPTILDKWSKPARVGELYLSGCSAAIGLLALQRTADYCGPLPPPGRLIQSSAGEATKIEL